MIAETKNIAGVRFKRAGRAYYFDAGDLELEVNDYVVVETERGLDLGRVVIAPKQVIASEIAEPLKPVLRKATPEDFQQQEEAKKKEEEVFSRCKELVAKFNLPMKLLGIESNIAGTRFTIFFSAESRVDFRDLIRELTSAVRTRVELWQVGARDEAKLAGGYGRCGRHLCCATFITEFTPLTIKMAKEQGLSLNPMKISGICGRLLCCLGYEIEFYRQMKGKMPPLGQRIVTPQGEAKVIGVNPLKETVTVQLDSEATIELSLAEIASVGSWEEPKQQEEPEEVEE